jgi:ethanolamine-phosphate cytidylyltransferase
VKIYIDGAFDLIHSGHYNAIRQARALGGHLTMGVNSDETIMANKGPTVLTTAERAKIIRSCKWIDDVVEGTDYEL